MLNICEYSDKKSQMYLAVFHEFCDTDLLDVIRVNCPDLEIKISTPVGYSSSKCDTILQTTAKLFYEKSTLKNEVDDILLILKRCGLNVKIRDPFALYKERKTVLIPSIECEYKTCECGNAICVPKKPESKVVVVEVKHYYNDRVILEIDYLLQNPKRNDVIFRLAEPHTNLFSPYQSPYQYTGLICTPEGKRATYKRG